LQRHSHKPQIIHVKRLNVLLRWIQANPKKIEYRKLNLDVCHMRAISDAAFKKEDDKGYSLRGCVYVLMPGKDTADYTKSGTAHVIDYACKAQRHVVRATFSSELFASCDSVDHGILLQLMLHEIRQGPVSKMQGRQLREQGGYAIPAVVYLDALSVYAAVTATNIKIPAEKSLLSHIQFIRETLDNKVLQAIVWLDTRDMIADGLTKGTVERDLLHLLMSGKVQIMHECKLWASKYQKPQGSNRVEDPEQ